LHDPDVRKNRAGSPNTTGDVAAPGANAKVPVMLRRRRLPVKLRYQAILMISTASRSARNSDANGDRVPQISCGHQRWPT
jgi:hypothetical protein